MGRPIQLPAVKAFPFGNGGFRWRVTATVGGKQQKRIFASQADALTQASQWAASMQNAFFSVYTRIPPAEISAHEAALQLLKDSKNGLSVLQAVQFAIRHFVPLVAKIPEDAVVEYETEKKIEGLSDSQISNVARTARRLFRHLRKPLDSLTPEVFRGFLSEQTDLVEPSSFNGLLGDCRTFFRWCVSKKYMAVDPAVDVPRRKVKDKLPTTLSPTEAAAFMQLVESQYPGWVPYAAFCLFAAIRPALRDGEASRLHAALVACQPVFHDDGFDIDGKAHGIRLVPWVVCGPLRAWLASYPIPAGGGLWPVALSPTAAEREWAKVRATCGIGQDVLRHTGVTAMCYAPGGSLAAASIAAGNSEAIIRKRYLGRWSSAKTAALWAILPSRPRSGV